MHDATLVSHTIVARLAQAMHDPDLLAEVSSLAKIIATTRTELQRLDAGPFLAGQIPAATDELDAVVAHTASATDAILQVCEELEQAGEGGGADAALLQRATTRIYEACGFQDITGQRISKVVATLKAIESKVGQILRTIGTGEITEAVPEAPQRLANGPQLPGAAMHQADIDKLLADF